MDEKVRDGTDICALVTGSIEPADLAEAVRTDASGAVALFTGTVRNHHRGRSVESLEYEAYAPMAEGELGRIAREMRARWRLEGIALVHRVGHLKVGETSVAVVVAAAHRREALAACAWGIDRIKETVPIWKKEHGEAGAGWVIGDESPRALPRQETPRKGGSSRRRRSDA